MNSSVARLRQQIELECEAMQQALTGIAAVAKHEVIAHRYEAIGQCQDQLEKIVGKTEAALITVQAYMKVMER